MAKSKNNQSKTNDYSSFGVGTLIKLAAIEADKNHNGEFTIIAAAGEFKAVYGQGAPSQAESVPAHDSLKSALVALLVESPTFAGESALAASRRF
jgi:hypothetical protein